MASKTVTRSINFHTSKEFTADDLELVFESESEIPFDSFSWSFDVSTVACSYLNRNTCIAHAEWVDIVTVFYDCRSDKFKCTSALNKLRIREENAFEQPALINLIKLQIRTNSLMEYWKWMIYLRFKHNERFAFYLAEGLFLCTWKLLNWEGLFCMEAYFMHDFWKPVL